MLCAAPGRPPILVSALIWEALCKAGSGAKYSKDLGIPVMDNDIPIQRRIIQADARSLELAGGSWGPAQLVRDDRNNTWYWQPQVSFSHDQGGLWYGAGTSDLRLRAEATIYWVEPCVPVTSQAWRELTESLSDSELAHAISGLAIGQGADLPTIRWHVGRVTTDENLQSSFTDIISGPHARPSLRAKVSLLPLPSCAWRPVITTAEVHVDNFMASQNAMYHRGGPYPDDSKLWISLDELLGILAASWQAVTEVLPAVVVEDPASMLLTDPPVVDLSFSTREVRKGNSLDIRDIVRLLSLDD